MTVLLGRWGSPSATVSHSSCRTALRTNESMPSLPVTEHNWLSRCSANAADEAVTVSPGTSSSRSTYQQYPPQSQAIYANRNSMYDKRSWKPNTTRWHLAHCIPQPHHTDSGTVSFTASSMCTNSPPRLFLNFIFTFQINRIPDWLQAASVLALPEIFQTLTFLKKLKKTNKLKTIQLKLHLQQICNEMSIRHAWWIVTHSCSCCTNCSSFTPQIYRRPSLVLLLTKGNSCGSSRRTTHGISWISIPSWSNTSECPRINDEDFKRNDWNASADKRLKWETCGHRRIWPNEQTDWHRWNKLRTRPDISYSVSTQTQTKDLTTIHT